MLTNPRKILELAASARGAWWATVHSVHSSESDTPEATKQQQSTNVVLSESVSHSVVSNSLWPHGLYSPPGSSAHGIIQARIWVAIPSSRGSSWPRDRTRLSCIVGRFFTIWAIREAQYGIKLVGYLEICKMSTVPDTWSTSYTWKLLRNSDPGVRLLIHYHNCNINWWRDQV